VDFYALNKASVKDNFPLPNMEMILKQVVGSQMMSLLEIFFGYNQIELKGKISIKPHSQLDGAPFPMNKFHLSYLMQVLLSIELCK
jgi:hypothetical protein